ncbi:AAA family ATPase [Roseateles sp. P5_E7]
MLFQVQLENVRPIHALTFSVDLARNAPLCIVGRNGAGKTTLAKAIMNFALADTFSRTTSEGALRDNSVVHYTIGNSSFAFTFDPAVGTLSTRQPVPESLRQLISVELPIPHGQRFSYFRTLAEADGDIRTKITLEQESRPQDLIDFLTRIYSHSRFEDLREVSFSRGVCSFYRTDAGRYVREDYFSSGEFFLVNLYRRLQSGTKLIFIDEIDISLDAAAQARLVQELRTLCTRFSVNVVFTSHSLALMQTLRAGELRYLEPIGDRSLLEERSFSFVKSVMFGFQGYDRYILVEDDAAKQVVEHFIETHCTHAFYRHLIIEVGGAGQVISLLRRNRAQGFLGPADAVIAILDGDQAGTGHANEPDTHCMPVSSLERAFEAAYNQPTFTQRLPPNVEANLPQEGRHKALYSKYRRYAIQSDRRIVELACESQAADIQAFSEQVLVPFLTFQPGRGQPAQAAAE